MATNSIGRAALILTTNDRGLSSGLDKVSDRIRQFQQSVASGFRNFAIAGASAGAFVIQGRLIGEVIESIKEKADLSQQARSLGIPVAAFQALKAAAESAEVDVSGLKEALINLGGRVNEARSGNQNAAASFRTLGVELNGLRGKRLDEQFLQVADALGRVPDAGDRARIALSVLGEEAGKKLLPLLADGAAKFRKFADEQRRTGQVISQAEAEQIERARAAFPRIQASWEGLKTRLVVASAPLVESIAKSATDAALNSQAVFEGLGRGAAAFFGVVTPLMKEFIDLGTTMQTEFSHLLTAIFPLEEAVSVEEVVTGALLAIGIAGAATWDALRVGAGAFVLGVVGVADALGAVIDAFGDLVDLGAELPEELGGGQFKEWAADIKAFAREGEDNLESLRAWGTAQMESFGQSVDDLFTWYERIRQGRGEVERAATQVQEAAQQLGQVLKPNAAVESGSKEDFSARVQWQFQNEQADKNLAEARKVAANTAATVDAVRGLGDQLWRLAPLGGV